LLIDFSSHVLDQGDSVVREVSLRSLETPLGSELLVASFTSHPPLYDLCRAKVSQPAVAVIALKMYFAPLRRVGEARLVPENLLLEEETETHLN